MTSCVHHRSNISKDKDAALKSLEKLRLMFEYLNSLLYQRKRQLNDNETIRLQSKVEVYRIKSLDKKKLSFLGTYLLRIVQIDGTHLFLEIISESDGTSCYVYPLLQKVPSCFKIVDNQIIVPDFKEEGCELSFDVSPYADLKEFIEDLNTILVEGDSTAEESHQSKDGESIASGVALIGMRTVASATTGARKMDQLRSFLTSRIPKGENVPPVSDTVSGTVTTVKEVTAFVAERTTANVEKTFDNLKTYGALFAPTEASSPGIVTKIIKDLVNDVGTSKDILTNSFKSNVEQGVAHALSESHGYVARDTVEIVGNALIVSGNVIFAKYVDNLSKDIKKYWTRWHLVKVCTNSKDLIKFCISFKTLFHFIFLKLFTTIHIMRRCPNPLPQCKHRLSSFDL